MSLQSKHFERRVAELSPLGGEIMKAKSKIEAARKKVQSELKGKSLVRVNYDALEKKTPLYPQAMFYIQSGWYRDYPFHCADCQRLEIWTDTQQKWWYEVAKGGRLTVATRCRRCRKIQKVKKEIQRAKTIAGHEKKNNGAS